MAKKNTKSPVETMDDSEKGNTDRLTILKGRLSVAKAFCKKPHEGYKQWIKEYEIEDFGDTEQIRDKVRIGYIFRKTESELPAIFDDQPEIFIKGRHSQTKDVEPLINGTYDYLWDIQNMEEKIEDAGLYFELVGLGVIKSPWVTKTQKVPQTDQQGNPVLDEKGKPQMYDYPIVDNPEAEVVDIFKIFFSPETKFSPTLPYKKCPYLFEELVMTPEEIYSKFGKKVKASETMKLDDPIADQELSQDFKDNSDDMKRVTVYEYYGCLPEEHAKDLGAWEYDKDYHIFMTNNEELLAEECQYTVKPYFPVGNYGLSNKFWRFGDAKHLMPLVQELEKYRSQILNHNRFSSNPMKLMPTNGSIDEQALRNPLPGNIVKYDGITPPSFLAPAPLGREVSVGVDMVRTDLEKTAGTFDLAGGGGGSQVKTPRGIQVYSEASDRSVRRKKKKIARLIRQLIIFQFQQISQNWKPEDQKTLSIIADGTPQSVPVTKEVLDVLGGVTIMYSLDIEVESLSINRVQMKQEALDLWDLAIKSPGIFNMTELAKDMLQNGFGKKDADRFLLSEEDKQKLAQGQKPAPGENVSIRVDANTPIGAQLLEVAGLLPQGTAQQMIAAHQQIAQQIQGAALPPELANAQQQNQLPQDASQGGMNATPQPQFG